jgi:hypothetical protein
MSFAGKRQAMARPSLVTDYHQCPACQRVRIIWPVDEHGKALPPVNWTPDPAGVVAVQHTAAGTWLARILGQGDPAPVFPEKRFRWHRETCQQARTG